MKVLEEYLSSLSQLVHHGAACISLVSESTEISVTLIKILIKWNIGKKLSAIYRLPTI